MGRQHSLPYVVVDGQVSQLQPAISSFDEDWLQEFVFKHPQALPLGEVEPAFAPLIPVCRELPTPSGPVDLLFVNPDGLLTLVECKLWKNPQARREVVGQILDYAKELSRWSYEDLEKAIKHTSGSPLASLYELAAAYTNEVDERDFIDSVSRNLRRGRFLLLIVGDGVRENVERMTTFLQRYAHLDFSLALIEFGVFQLPAALGGHFVVQPRLVAQTAEIGRVTFRFEDGRVVPVSASSSEATLTAKRGKITEELFYEKLAADAGVKASLQAFFKDGESLGLYVEPGSNSLILKSNLYDVNLGVFTAKGEFYNRGICASADDLGRPEIGEGYLNGLAALIPHGIVQGGSNRFVWTVKVKIPQGARFARIGEVLAVQDKWLALIQDTVNRLAEAGAG